LPDRLKNLKEKIENSSFNKPTQQDKDKILNDIKKSQAQKQCMKIHKVLNPDQPYVELDKLRNITWNGIPATFPQYRCEAWKLLLDYIPIDQEFRSEMLGRKREEYFQIVKNYFGDFSNEAVQDLLNQDNKNRISSAKIQLSDFEKRNLKQVKIDVLRTQPEITVFKSDQMQCMMTRLLFTWAVRHPASGYVQGISDLCAPLLLVFMSEFVFKADKREYDLSQ
jgi:hypothetical protein